MLTPDEQNCTDENECLSHPCMNGAICVNLDNGNGFQCICAEGYSGDLCDAVHQEKVMRLSNAALAAILICLANILSECSFFAASESELRSMKIVNIIGESLI